MKIVRMISRIEALRKKSLKNKRQKYNYYINKKLFIKQKYTSKYTS